MNQNLRGARYSPSPAILHEYARDRLYVTLVKGSIIPGNYLPDQYYYVQCSKFGTVDWETAVVYPDVSELIIRDNVFVIRNHQGSAVGIS